MHIVFYDVCIVFTCNSRFGLVIEAKLTYVTLWGCETNNKSSPVFYWVISFPRPVHIKSYERSISDEVNAVYLLIWRPRRNGAQPQELHDARPADPSSRLRRLCPHALLHLFCFQGKRVPGARLLCGLLLPCGWWRLLQVLLHDRSVCLWLSLLLLSSLFTQCTLPWRRSYQRNTSDRGESFSRFSWTFPSLVFPLGF